MDNNSIPASTPDIVGTTEQERVYDVAPAAAARVQAVLSRPIILGDLTLASPSTVTTIGVNGAATALTANPVGYLVINIGNASYQVPYYALA